MTMRYDEVCAVAQHVNNHASHCIDTKNNSHNTHHPLPPLTHLAKQPAGRDPVPLLQARLAVRKINGAALRCVAAVEGGRGKVADAEESAPDVPVLARGVQLQQVLAGPEQDAGVRQAAALGRAQQAQRIAGLALAAQRRRDSVLLSKR